MNHSNDIFNSTSESVSLHICIKIFADKTAFVVNFSSKLWDRTVTTAVKLMLNYAYITGHYNP